MYARISPGQLRGVKFAAYTPEEVKKMSVLHITNQITFDMLGYPVKGGLHDSLLGPNEKFEVCATCGQNSVHCPGHLGHIELPLPVFNPVFMKTIMTLLRSCCSSCNKMTVSPSNAVIFMGQMKALNSNNIELAFQLEDMYGEIINEPDGDIARTISHVTAKINEQLRSSGAGISETEHPLFVKNLVEAQKKILKSFWECRTEKRTCPHCRRVIPKLALEFNTRIIRRGVTKTKRVATSTSTSKKSKAQPRLVITSPMKGEKPKEGPGEETTPSAEPLLNEDVTSGLDQTYFTPLECQNMLRAVWKNNASLLSCLFGCLATGTSSPVDIFFVNTIPVPPSRFRPINEIRGQKIQHPLTTQLAKVIQICSVLRYVLDAMRTGQENAMPPDIMTLLDTISGKSLPEKLQHLWGRLQHNVNVVYDGNLEVTYGLDAKPAGIKQLLEKKEGLFRMHMMGKRVNYAARSVISPDPYIKVDEIGVPETFALKLTYPQTVTPWNVEELRQAVLNGPEIHPGASLVQNDDGSLVRLSAANVAQREAIAKSLLTPSVQDALEGPKVVYRHLKNGDMLLINRQPTLHKPSIMAHKARVLPKEKTLRLNYSNCKTYNADFDGDEMNAHFPQSELARAEAHLIASVNNQYLVPKDGTPLGGLIQDHIVSGVRMMIRGKFFSREDYQQLVFVALTHKDGEIKLLMPAILKPVPLWSGKQVISTILINTIPAHRKPLTLISKSKIPVKTWQKETPRLTLDGICMSESEVIIHNGELLCGILDKSHCGPTPYGLTHCCYELYGGEISGLLLSHLSRVFTHCLQIGGFTLGVEDILLTEKADRARRRLMRKAAKVGHAAAAKAMGASEECDLDHLKTLLRDSHLGSEGGKMKDLDNCVKEKIGSIVNDINSACMPQGLLKKFPDNNLQLMVISGAKGSSVNTMQISCLLGQIELEGKRPPLMISGKTLPSFLAYDTSPRAGGFVDGRFLTGIRPQEFFFHCMAGREGLVDTAVKTSRSGYLQRCLIKHLEGVTVAYDMTVRDCDGSVIQFLFGDDGLDILKVPFLIKEQFNFFADNVDAAAVDKEVSQLLANTDYKKITKFHKKIRHFTRKSEPKTRLSAPFVRFSSENSTEFADDDPIDPKTGRTQSTSEICQKWYDLSLEESKRWIKPTCPDPVTSKWRPDCNLGAICERLDSIIETYLKDNPRFSNTNGFTKEHFRKLIHHKALRSICEPGEAVGLLAAQSIGEPSTQMTLNTFHFAGRGDMNVTLGIPRLREILMTASANISTPHMSVPFLPGKKVEKRANKLRQRFTRVCLNEILEKVILTESISVKKKNRVYTLRFQFLPLKYFKMDVNLAPSKILAFMEKVFLKHFTNVIHKKRLALSKSGLVSNVTIRETTEVVNDGDADGTEKQDKNAADSSDEDDDTAMDDDAKGSKNKQNKEKEYSESEDDGKSDEENEKEDSENASISKDSIEDEEEEEEEIIEKEIDITEQNEMSELDKNRVNVVLEHNRIVEDYRFDTRKEEWCEITYLFPMTVSGLPMESILRAEVPKAFLNQTLGLRRAFVIENPNLKGPQKLVLQTEGVNFKEISRYSKILDLNRVYTNDIHKMVQMFGIEAGARVIVKEIQDVFGVYGIEVDPRHLSLIADFMTFEGKFCGFNRTVMENSPSPLLQMTYETTMHFLKEATLSGNADNLQSPSARLVVGRLVGGGTGICSIVQPLT